MAEIAFFKPGFTILPIKPSQFRICKVEIIWLFQNRFSLKVERLVYRDIYKHIYKGRDTCGTKWDNIERNRYNESN